MMNTSKLAELSKINPLIEVIDTSSVESVLNLVSFLILDTTAGDVSLDADQAQGLAFVLDTCRAALKAMREDGEVAA